MYKILYNIGKQIANGLYGMSRVVITGRTLVHKDLKLDNILVRVGWNDEECRNATLSEDQIDKLFEEGHF